MVLTPDFTKAVAYACAHHAADVRKGTSVPYVAHLLAVRGANQGVRQGRDGQWC